MVLVHLGSPEDGKAFLDARWPEARAVSDENKSLYEGFGLSRASLGQLFGPRAFWAGLRSTMKGHGIGKPVGDVVQMSGWFLVQERRILWRHVHEHAGAPRRWDALQRAWAQAREDRPAT